MVILQKRMWILAGDGANARILPYSENQNADKARPIKTFHHHAAPSRELGSDKPGRSFDRKGHNRHAIVPRTDAHEREEQQFLKSVIDQLDKDLADDHFDECVVILPPRALGYFRQHLTHALKQHVVLEICRDFTKLSDPEIISAFRNSLRPQRP